MSRLQSVSYSGLSAWFPRLSGAEGVAAPANGAAIRRFDRRRPHAEVVQVNAAILDFGLVDDSLLQ